MQKRVQRREVDIKVNVAGSPISAKVGGQKQSPSPAKPANSTFYNLPDPGALAAKYGIPDPDAANSNNNNSNNSAANDQSATIAEYEAIISTMRSKVEEKNRKIEQLCVMMEALEPVPGVDPARVQAILNDRLAEDEIDLRDGKIVALAKKSHRLTMQLNKEKATNDRLSQDIVELKRKNDTLLQEIDMLKAAEASRGAETKTYNRHALAHAAKKEEEDQKQESAVNVQRQLRESAKLIDELKAKVKDLSEENKGLSRALQRELGDGVALEQAVDGGWRGRAQQIIMLKSKVKQLEQQLQQGGGGGGGPSSSHGTRRQSSSGYGGQGQGQAQDVDSKAVEEIQEMSRERRQIVEALTEERVRYVVHAHPCLAVSSSSSCNSVWVWCRLMEQNQALEKRNQGTKARVTILENEIKKLKENLTVRVSVDVWRSWIANRLLGACRWCWTSRARTISWSTRCGQRFNGYRASCVRPTNKPCVEHATGVSYRAASLPATLRPRRMATIIARTAARTSGVNRSSSCRARSSDCSGCVATRANSWIPKISRSDSCARRWRLRTRRCRQCVFPRRFVRRDFVYIESSTKRPSLLCTVHGTYVPCLLASLFLQSL